MKPIVVHSRIGADGVLQLTVPVGEADAEREVEVTIALIGSPPMTHEEWDKFVMTTAGSITDPSFLRHQQGQYEGREELP